MWLRGAGGRRFRGRSRQPDPDRRAPRAAGGDPDGSDGRRAVFIKLFNRHPYAFKIYIYSNFRTYDSPSWQTGKITYYRYAGAKIVPESGSTESDRQLRGTYWHTWNATEVDSVGISSGGAVSLTLINNDKKWDRPMQALLNEAEDKKYT